MDPRPVILSQQVCMSYQSQEVSSLLKAATQLPPYEIQEFTRYIRIDCYSLGRRGWRCAFIISKASENQPDCMLDAIEYIPELTFHHALASLGHLENCGLQRLKYGL